MENFIFFYSDNTMEHLRKIGKSLPEYLILHGCSEFILLIKIQKTSIT